MRVLRVLGATSVFAAAVYAQPTRVPQSPVAVFAKLQSLAGDWEGSAVHDGKQMPTTTSFRVVADGSAIMDDLAPGTPHEMITMFHMDGKDLLATHYCSHHNQPRLLALPTADPSVVEFAFKDATNLANPADAHMIGVKFTILDANHHVEEWTAAESGHPVTLRFEFHRKH
jgi:hypothetical protein